MILIHCRPYIITLSDLSITMIFYILLFIFLGGLCDSDQIWSGLKYDRINHSDSDSLKFVIIGHDRAGALLCRMIVPNGVLVHF